MESKNASLLLLVLLFASVAYFLSSYRPPERKAAVISFVPDFPPQMVAGTEVMAYLDVSCSEGDAKDISVLFSSDAFASSSDRKDIIRAGATERMSLRLFAKDIEEGNYPVTISLQYSDYSGTFRTEPKTVYMFMLPSVELTDTMWKSEFPQLMGKNRIKQNDETALYLRIQSRSKAVIYRGLSVKAALSTKEDIGVSVDPPSRSVEPLGPAGTSPRYTFNLKSKNAIVGSYQLELSLYSKDGKLIQKKYMDFFIEA